MAQKTQQAALVHVNRPDLCDRSVLPIHSLFTWTPLAWAAVCAGNRSVKEGRRASVICWELYRIRKTASVGSSR